MHHLDRPLDTKWHWNAPLFPVNVPLTYKPATYRILVADDDRMTLKMISDTLRAGGYTVIPVKNGRAAVKAFQKYRPDVVMLDVFMPKLDGLEACREIKSDRRGGLVPIMMVTSRTDEKLIRIAFATGATDYLRKPFDPDLLRQKVGKLLSIRDLWVQLYNATERLRTVLDTVGVGMFMVDAAGCPMFVNPHAEQVLGWSCSELAGCNMMDVLLPKDHPSRRQAGAVDTYLQTISKLFVDRTPLDETFVTKGGDRIHVSFVSSAFFSGNGEWEGAVVAFQDMTERFREEKRIKDDLLLATRVQQSMLPADYLGKDFMIRGFSEPCSEINGDSYGFFVSPGTPRTVFGYVVDVMGHGMSTVLQGAALHALMNGVAQRRDEPLTHRLRYLNKMALPYFKDHDSYAAAIIFELNLDARRLDLVSAGINFVGCQTQKVCGVVEIPGFPIGAVEEVGTFAFSPAKFAVKPGDVFYFMSDGMLDLVGESFFSTRVPFEDAYTALRESSRKIPKTDDATALVLVVK